MAGSFITSLLLGIYYAAFYGAGNAYREFDAVIGKFAPRFAKVVFALRGA